MAGILKFPLKAVLVGCGGMGMHQAQILSELEQIEFTAVCDINSDNASKLAQNLNIKSYTDFDEMLALEKPDVVNICTAHDSHAALTIKCAQAGVAGVFCEKPMATCMGEGKAMVEACRKSGTFLVINHQRRLGADLVKARQLIEEGALGEIKLIRGQCAGDVIGDGTHLVDSLMWLSGSTEIEWILAQVHCEQQPDDVDGSGNKSVRYGVAVENGAMAVIKLKDGPRLELFCGDMVEQSRVYQDYEVIGTKARLWRTGDSATPNLFIQDSQGGSWEPGFDEWVYKPVASGTHMQNGWRPVLLSEGEIKGIKLAYLRFLESLSVGTYNPMNGDNGLLDLEVVMGIYESARLGKKVFFPLEQQAYPLDLLLQQQKR